MGSGASETARIPTACDTSQLVSQTGLRFYTIGSRLRIEKDNRERMDVR